LPTDDLLAHRFDVKVLRKKIVRARRLSGEVFTLRKKPRTPEEEEG